MRKHILIALALILVVAAGIGVGVQALNSAVVFTKADEYSDVQFKSPFRGDNPLVSPNSPFSKPRDTGTCPHVGVDFPVRYVPVYFNVDVTERRPAYIKFAGIYPKDGTKAVHVSYDMNGDGVVSSAERRVWARYLHLDSINENIGQDTLIKEDQPVGITGDTGASGKFHLHWDVKQYSPDCSVGLSAPPIHHFRDIATFYPNLPNAAAWPSQLCFIKNTGITGFVVQTNVSYNVYTSGRAQQMYVNNAWIYFRTHVESGNPNPWQKGVMKKGAGSEFTYEIPEEYRSGTLEYFVVAENTNEVCPYNYAFDPAKYDEPLLPENDTAHRYQYDFYSYRFGPQITFKREGPPFPIKVTYTVKDDALGVCAGKNFVLAQP